MARKRKATTSIVLAFMLGGVCYTLFSNEGQAETPTTNVSVQQQPEDKTLAKIEVDEDGRVSGSFEPWKIAEKMWIDLIS